MSAAGYGIFKKCSCCYAVWESRNAFLSDPEVEIVGYQVFFTGLLSGAFLFNHSCETTLAMEVSLFRDLYEGPVFSESLAGKEGCPEYCLRINSLEPCPEKCECAFVREILQIVRNWPKASLGAVHP